MLVGHVKGLMRHPVKSFTGEEVKQTYVMPYGLYGDRSHAYRDLTRSDKFLTITQAPQMACYTAAFDGEDDLEHYPPITVRTPDGTALKWDDPRLIEELVSLSGRSIQPVHYTTDAVPIGPLEEDHLLLVSDASIQSLSEEWGKTLDYRRFRPNILLSLTEQQPFIEEQWFGKTLLIGNTVKISINKPCERCMIITVDPETGVRDPSLLKIVTKSRQNHFGVYASVITTGPIHIGDEIHLLA
ncbi:MOSC domain-containing protein [Pradoshia sp.]